MKIGRRIVLIIVITIIYQLLTPAIRMPDNIIVKAGDTFTIFTQELSSFNRLRTKIYTRLYDANIDRLQVGNYQFTGSYSPASLIDHIQAGPTQKFTAYTILEGRSIYDIDASLADRELIQQGEYINYVTNNTVINSLQSQYEFLQEAGSLSTLEGFLYPDTYHIDSYDDVIGQLVHLQLQTFQQKLRNNIDEKAIITQIQSDYPNVSLDRYDLLTLASIIQKEERNPINQPTIAGIFLNRLQAGMRLDADITLCYYFRQPYASCTPSVIARSVSDTTNPFNTRQRQGLPFQPIANIPYNSIQALDKYRKTDFLYYLHDASGNIHYGTTLQEHNTNKSRYLP